MIIYDAKKKDSLDRGVASILFLVTNIAFSESKLIEISGYQTYCSLFYLPPQCFDRGILLLKNTVQQKRQITKKNQPQNPLLVL